MDFLADAIAFCRNGIGTTAAVALPLSLFVLGLSGSLAHCVGMCGPFVLGQVMSDVETAGGTYSEWRRLAGAALLPYHLGRFTSYTLLGAIAGTVTALFAATPAFAWLAGALLLLAAALMLAQAAGLALGTSASLADRLAHLVSPLAQARDAAGRYALGVALGFLPCGLLYGALAAAAGTGSAAQGALAMASFSVGTMPALVAVGWGGLLMRRRVREISRSVAVPLLLANAAVMLALASERF